MKAMLKIVLFANLFAVAHLPADAQNINALVQKAKQKIDLVNDYVASGKMKTNVTFLKVPIASVKIYFKRPNKLKLKSEKGVSFIPKGAVSLNLNGILGTNDYTIIDAGKELVGNVPVRVARLLPNSDNSDVVLSTLYIDEANNLILKAKTTTKDNGTYELEMGYGKYASYGLPDKIVFSFNTKDYKLPKGVTFDFDDGSTNTAVDKAKAKKGRAEIIFSNYIINKGIDEALLK
jgi:outer membrane lipoprotein-sorting protein